MLSSSLKTSDQSKNQRLQTCVDRAAVNLNSSPVIGANQLPALDTAESNEPQLPTQSAFTKDQINNDVSVHFPNDRREVFRMIESIRSSSPANSPGKLGYDTPVHLRRLRASQGITEIPPTPTLAPVENEEGYIGSSPTPATRDPTPAINSDAPVSRSQDVAMTDATDLPSSPPELGSRSPSPQKRSKRSRNERRKSARARKAMHRRSVEAQSFSNSPAKTDPVAGSATDLSQVDDQADPEENNDAPQVDERPPSRRLRSALSQSTDNEQNLASMPSFGITPKPTDTPSAEQSTRSKSGSKRRKRKSFSKTATGDGQQATPQAEALPAPPAPDDLVDSSSEDVETQIASQLEQDLELAMDVVVNVREESAQQPASPVSSKKRKREEEDARPTASKERRRSTRLSSTKDMAVIELEDPDATQSQDASGASQDLSLAKSTSPTLRRSTRGSQRREDASTPAVVSPATEVSESTQEPVPDQASSQPPAKRSRKSLRHEDQSEAAMEENSSQVKPTRARSRKACSSRNEAESQPQPSQEHATQADATPKEIELSHGQHADQDVPPESNVQEQAAVPPVPLVSTEEATDSQMTDMGPPTNSDPASTENKMRMNVEPVPNQGPTAVLEQVTTTAEVQTDPIHPHPEPDASESGITQSLKRLLDDMKLATLGPQALREVDDLLFNIRVEAHDASRRHKPA